MHKLFKALLLGLAAGILDVIPMVFQGLSWEANISALVHWIGLGVIITFARMPISSWASGIVIAVLTAIPIAVLVLPTDPGAIIPILLFSVILGGLLGYTSERLIHNQP